MTHISAKSLIITALFWTLFLASHLVAYEDTLGIDTSAQADTVTKAVEVYISTGQIQITYDDGSDTLIERPGFEDGRKARSSVANAIIKIGEDETIGPIDSVRGEVVILIGNLAVEGYVKGDVTVLVGDILVGSTGSIEGEINCFGTVTLDSGAHVWGDISAKQLNKPTWDEYFEFRGEYTPIQLDLANLEFLGPLTLVAMAVLLAVVLFTVSITSLIMPKPIARVRFQVDNGFIRCFLIGVLLIVALLPIWVLLLITVVGIPVAVFIFPFLVAGAFILGAIGFTQFAGYMLGRHTTLRYRGFLRTTIAGAILMGSPLILATFFNFINLHPLAWPFQIIFLIGQFIMFSTGLGAVFFSRFGSQPKEVSQHPLYEDREQKLGTGTVLESSDG